MLTVAIAGAPDENGGLGSATIYRYNGSTWLPQKITQTSPVNQGFFGSSVAISGNRAIVGVPNGVVIPSQSGLAVIYDYNGSNWIVKQNLFDAARDNGDNFGCSVSISGNNAIVGARLDDNPLGNEGSATIYEYDGSVWATIQKLKLTASNSINASLGYSVSISGNYALAGAFTDDVNSVTDQGTATLFVKIGSFWQRVQLITDPQGMQNDRLGAAGALDAGTGRFITASDNFNNGQGKVIFGKIN
ncbi:MAG: hypothetical protein EOO03_06460 [Chitinophagaceae bacterium]|nr:MAG: hypothetical protein EOO03_06460 [Chitinophagaceae bacterium]